MKSKRTKTLLLTTIALALSASAYSAPNVSKSLSKSIDKVFVDYAKPDSPGCALAVYRDNNIWYQQGYGLASIEHQLPIKPQSTVFDIGSTSKQFMAASILLLEQDGKLKTSDDIRKYLPEMPDYGHTITINHLLHHTSGIRDYIALMMMADIKEEDHTTEAQALSVIARQKALDFVPGSEHSYSNSGYFLLSQILQRVSGKSWVEFAQERLFKPLGMNHTQVLNNHKKIIKNKAASYQLVGENEFGVQMSNWEQTGDGAVQTTVADLVKWDNNFHQPKVGGQWLVEQLQQKTTLSSGEEIAYARGLFLDQYRGIKTVQHGGAWAGYRTELIRVPEEKLSVAVLCNQAESNPTQLAHGVLDVVLADKFSALEKAQSRSAKNSEAPQAAVQPVKNPEQYVGMYWSRKSGLIRQLEMREGKLFYVRGGGRDNELAQNDDESLTMIGAPFSVKLSFAKRGSTRVMTFDANSNKDDFEQVTPAKPTANELLELQGDYYSQELETVWSFVVEDNKLQLKMKRDENMVFEPKFTDAFEGQGLMMLVQRDSKAKVTGLAVNAGRARDLQFVKKAGQ